MYKVKVSLIAGGAGFIGVNLIRKLLSEGRAIVVADNLSRGRWAFIDDAIVASVGALKLVKCDCSTLEGVDIAFAQAESMGDLDEVWHLAANSDIPAGISDPQIDLRDTFFTTFHLLEGMKKYRVGTINFASSSAIYGDLKGQILREDSGPLLPISNYGAMKLASEAIISAALESFLDRVNIFRFPNVVGIPATHGVILDFVNKLNITPSFLQVLGDGTQQKSYLHVSDLIEAMFVIREVVSNQKIQLVNIGPLDDGVTVRWIAEQVLKRVSPEAKIGYGNGNKGWVGDVPRFNYSTQRLQSYGWRPRLSSAEAVVRAIDEISAQLGK